MNTPLQFFPYRKNELTAQGIPLRKIAEETGTPVYVYSAEAFLTPLREFQLGLKNLDPLICFAMKSNSNLSILKLLSDAGAGMDLVSGGELYRAQVAGVQANKIVFSGVGKTPKEMMKALNSGPSGIFSFNVESVAELIVLNEVANSIKRKASVALRFNPDVNPKTHPYISTGLRKNKFGMNRKEILDIVKNIKKFPGITLKGISVHIGSQLVTLSPMDDAFSKVRLLVEEIDSLLTTPIQFIDLGGGLGIQYKNEISPSIKKYCALVQKHFGPQTFLKSARRRPPLKILIEPGRILSGNSGVLLTEVIYRKARSDKDFLIVDAAMNDLMRPALYGSYHEIVPVKKQKKNSKVRKTNLVGPVCESSDCFGENRLLSTDLQKGDLLAILSAGAYGFSMASNYNSRPRPPEVLVENEDYKVIRRRETEEDLIRGEHLGR